MTAGSDPDLTEGTRVRVDLDEGDAAIMCTVFAFAGSVILARYEGRLTERLVRELVSGAEGYLVLEQGRGRGVKALRGSASLNGETTLALRITDTFQLGQRRESTRVALTLDVELAAVGSHAPAIATTTIDVSFGGVQVQRTAQTPVSDRYTLTLRGERLGAPVTVEAELARELPDALGLRFAEVELADRQRLIGLVLAHVTVPEEREPQRAEEP